MTRVTRKHFENPDEVRTFDKGRLELVQVGGLTIGRSVYEPGWKWSEHVGKKLGQTLCGVEHVGVVVKGIATAAFQDGEVVELRPGDIFHIPAEAHDSWVVGDDGYEALHFLGAEDHSR